MATVAFINVTTKRFINYIDDVGVSDYQGRTDVVIYINDNDILIARELFKHNPYLIQDAGTLLIRDMVQAEKDSLDADTAAALLAATRAAAKNNLVGLFPNPLFNRAVGGVQADEINILRQWMMQLAAIIQASTTLADYKTRCQALPTLPDRTLAQYKTAINNKGDSGNVDN